MHIAFDLAETLNKTVNEVAVSTGGFNDSFAADVRPADPRFGDFQINGVLAYAKRERQNPRQLATVLLEAMRHSGRFPEDKMSLDIAGPGFINITFTASFLQDWLKRFASFSDFQQGAGTRLTGKTVVVDYPSPNTAKQMHIGHLRPMVIGEAIQRILRFLGATIIRDNHIGDWGTNFGTLIMAIKREGVTLDSTQPDQLPLLERLYKQGTTWEQEDPALRDVSREELVKLQQGDPENTALWKKIVEISNQSFQQIYDLLGLQFEHTLGESFYRDKVDRVYRELTEAGLAVESEGALIVLHPEHPRFNKQPFIIRKKDGASNYASTDLATVLYRVENWNADEIVYITDGRQQDHFQQLFLTVEKWFKDKGYPFPELRHVWFGTILGEDGKAIKTRSGEPIRLRELLNEAIERAHAIVKEKNPDLSPEEMKHIAQVVGLGAVRYADLSQNRTNDYVFSWDKLLSFEGNTAPYLLYAVARIHSIFRKVGIAPDTREIADQAGNLETPEEIALARKLIGFPNVLQLATHELRPHFLCTYLFELAGEFSTFYNASKVIVDEPGVQARRLLLCSRTLSILETGLYLLGISTLQRM